MSAIARNKGTRVEREVLKLLGHELGVLLERNLTQTRGGGLTITLTGDEEAVGRGIAAVVEINAPKAV